MQILKHDNTIPHDSLQYNNTDSNETKFTHDYGNEPDLSKKNLNDCFIAHESIIPLFIIYKKLMRDSCSSRSFTRA